MRFERLDQIRNLLDNEKSITLDELCRRMEVSKNTIRRDIVQLEKEGRIQKFYGGIRLIENNDAPTPFTEREITNSEAKMDIAKKAAKLVLPGEVIYIDSGTTTMHMVQFLVNTPDITIITTSLHVMLAASKYKINLIGVGGTLYFPAKSFVGAGTVLSLSQYNIGKVFMSSSGITLKQSVTNANLLECENKRAVMRNNAEKFLLIDNSKFGRSALMTYAQVSDFNAIITNHITSPEYKQMLDKLKVSIIQ